MTFECQANPRELIRDASRKREQLAPRETVLLSTIDCVYRSMLWTAPIQGRGGIADCTLRARAGTISEIRTAASSGLWGRSDSVSKMRNRLYCMLCGATDEFRHHRVWMAQRGGNNEREDTNSH